MRLVRAVLVASLLAPVAAGAQWVAQQSGTTAELRGVSIAGSRVVWASGTGGHVLRTTDGGMLWRADTVAGATALDFRDVEGVSAMAAWAMSSGDADKGQARIYRTTNGGTRWTLEYTTDRKGVFLDALAFWDSRHGIALSDPIDGRFFILTTSDGGRHWTRVPPERLPANLPGEAAFAASGTCLSVEGSHNVWIATGGGARSRVFRSTDRGRTWSVSDVPGIAGGASAGLFSVAFRDARHGVTVGGDYRKPNERSTNVALTSDGGRTWTAATGPLPAGFMSGVAYVPGTRAAFVAVGLAGTAVSSDGGRSWAMVDTVAYNAVAFAAPRDGGWAVGPHGRIAKWHGTVSSKTDVRPAR